MHLSRIHFLIAFFGAIKLFPGTASAEAWPRLQGERSEACLEALAIGQQAFRATHHSLLAPSDMLPGTVRSARLLGVNEYDISGGDAIVADSGEFEKLPQTDPASRSIYWQRAATAGLRIVIAERSRGWRGDMYLAHVLPQSVTSAAFLQEGDSLSQRSTWKPILDWTWRPPSIFRTASGIHWLLHPGEPYDFLAPWSVHEVGEKGVRLSCTLQFRPKVTAAVNLLPPEVRRLEKLLDRTIGSGENEGTLQPTARLRLSVQQTWANVALRPWALGSPYNTRAETDAGLSAWAAADPANRRLLAAIGTHAKVAQRALTRYYARTFPPVDARAAATFAIDVAVRQHYVFSSDDPERHSRKTIGPNPWAGAIPRN